MSYMSRLVRVFLGLWLLGLAPAYGQEKKPPEKPWTGKLADGRVITRGDLGQILKDHKRWVEHPTKGKRAKLSGATLSGAKLSGAKLILADLSGADLTKADLGGASLRGAILRGANLGWSDLSEAKLDKANLVGAQLSVADLSRADLDNANLSGAELIGANLSGADLSRASLRGANLWGANLTRAYLIEADLGGARLRGAILSGADLTDADLGCSDLSGADLSWTRFEPKPGSLPGITGLLYLHGLDSLKFKEANSYGLMELRETFKKAGMRDQERQLTYALNHIRRVNAWEIIKKKAEIEKEEKGKTEKAKGEKKEITWLTVGIAWLGNKFEQVMFEWTCDYGMTPSRPLLIMFAFLFVFTLPYLLALGSRNPRAGIWLVLLPDRVLDRQIKDRPVKLTFRTPLRRPLPAKLWARFRARCRRVWRGLRLALYFSLLSAFNIGWRELNVGNWITRIQKREYTLRGTGWVRMISGIQALLSVYLLALWVLTYFGRPFE